MDGGKSTNVLYNSERLKKLLTNLYLIAGIQTNIYDTKGVDTQLFGNHADFCRVINSTEAGHARCLECDREGVRRCAQTRKPYRYRCHAGLWEVIIPIFDSGEPVAFIAFGQLLDDSSYREQWAHTLSTLSWYTGDIIELRDCFWRLIRLSEEKRRAYEDVLCALTSYIQLERMIHSAELSDEQRLDEYISKHYMEKLSLKTMSDELHMGTTKLCALAKKLSGDGSVTKLISARRVNEAKTLLGNTGLSIAEIAERVGFSDYNYFTKIFKKNVGVTPSEFRKRGGKLSPGDAQIFHALPDKK